MCDICSQQFSTKGYLKYHIETVHCGKHQSPFLYTSVSIFSPENDMREPSFGYSRDNPAASLWFYNEIEFQAILSTLNINDTLLMYHSYSFEDGDMLLKF